MSCDRIEGSIVYIVVKSILRFIVDFEEIWV